MLHGFKKILSALLLVTALLALPSCGTPIASSPDTLEQTQSALAVPVGTHRAVGTMTCNLPFPFPNITYQVSTMLYIVQRPYPNSWYMDLHIDPNAPAGSVTVDRVAITPIESSDNGSVVYSNTAATIYMHKVVPFVAYDYNHDELAPPYGVQFWPADGAHPLGQLVLSLYPQGNSDPSKGECKDPVGVYLTIQP